MALSKKDVVVSGDHVVSWITSSGDYYAVPWSAVLAYMQNNLTFSVPGISYTTQYSAPSATGFNVAITDGSDNIHLILTPTTGFSTGTITLPSVASAIDRQEVLVNCTQQVTALTIDGNGATAVTGEPSALAADDFFRLKYDLPTKTWYRVG